MFRCFWGDLSVYRLSALPLRAFYQEGILAGFQRDSPWPPCFPLFLVLVGLYTNDLTSYENFLLLSGLNTLYGLVGMFLYPKNRRLGLLFLLPILTLLAYALLKVFTLVYSLR
ncbi:hypothetical protein A3K92_09030 [Thermococcus gorgonarius]|uniref:Uncharacterized protein n=1 Tax=Thermococcus gorgonarius TaxID=71997 RepID=A0A2Z2MAR3_THEGO|nr:hypothetical protein A3K92_09030 [Thermococcus gorgonarius]